MSGLATSVLLVVALLCVSNYAHGVSTSCEEVLKAAPGSPSGTYTIQIGSSTQNVYCEMNTLSGGWTLVGNQASTGSFLPGNSDLGLTASVGTYSASWSHTTAYLAPFAPVEHQLLMFKAGNGDATCVLPYIQVVTPNNDLNAKNVDVLYSSGAGLVPAGGKTNVLFRSGAAALPEDPWVGCAGQHLQNYPFMMWGESSFPASVQLVGATAPVGTFKNGNEGVGLFVKGLRLENCPTAVIPALGGAFTLSPAITLSTPVSSVTCQVTAGTGTATANGGSGFASPVATVTCSDALNIVTPCTFVVTSELVEDVSCVDLVEGFDCDKPHQDMEGPCIEVVTSSSLFRATPDHLIQTSSGWKLIREIRVGDVLQSGIVETLTPTFCKHLNSCQTDNRKFDAYGETFAQFALVTPDNYLEMEV